MSTKRQMVEMNKTNKTPSPRITLALKLLTKVLPEVGSCDTMVRSMIFPSEERTKQEIERLRGAGWWVSHAFPGKYKGVHFLIAARRITKLSSKSQARELDGCKVVR